MNAIKFKKCLVADGNPTLLVWNCPVGKKSEIIKKYLGEVEQIGFISSEKGLPKINMMGEELSINSILAFASCLKKKGAILSSGLDKQITYENKDNTTSISIPISFVKKKNIIILSGIGYKYINVETTTMKEDLLILAKKFGLPAFGYILYKNSQLTPYVYVCETNSLFKETACGSASVALNILLGLEKIVQPTKQPIFVKRLRDTFSVSAIVTPVKCEPFYDTITTNMNIQTLKGFRDFISLEARKRQYVISTWQKVFESFGFEPLVTPTLEYDDILTGKYGEEGEKLMYRFVDNGGRKVAMRYDQTVPTARVVAQYQNDLPVPYKRYQIQNVFRADNTQRGRYREFTQCDFDIIGIDTAAADAEIVATTYAAYKALGFSSIKLLLNDRSIFEGLTPTTIAIIDKLKKIGEEGVVKELVERNEYKTNEEAKNILQSVVDSKPTPRLKDIMTYAVKMGVPQEALQFYPTLARGLDYYTGMIFEVEILEYTVGSVAGGGRYDKLIGMFSGKDVPATGIALGFDRTVDALEELDLFPQEVLRASAKVLITVFSPALADKSLQIGSILREANIPTELWLDQESKMEKQLKYADQKSIPYAIIIGPEEEKKNTVLLKNLATRTQQELPLEDLLQKLQ